MRSSFCRKTCGGGGVMILSNNAINVKNVSIPKIEEMNKDKEFESCLVECRTGNFSFVVMGIYRTPGLAFDNIFLDKLEIALEILNTKYRNVIMGGDLNIDVLKDSRSHRRLSSILLENNMYYLVNFPTRVTVECESAIDNFITNISKEILQIEGIITNLSDHDAQLLKIKINNSGASNNILTQYCRKFNDENTKLFINYLQKETWLDVYNSPVERKYDVFHNIFMYYFNISFPLIKSRINRNRDKWITHELARDKEEIIHLTQNLRLTKDIALKRLLREKKKVYTKKLYSEKKHIWKIKLRILTILLDLHGN